MTLATVPGFDCRGYLHVFLAIIKLTAIGACVSGPHGRNAQKAMTSAATSRVPKPAGALFHLAKNGI
jgi:hypothetical protein